MGIMKGFSRPGMVMAVAALMGCSGGGDSNSAGSATLSVSLMDAPVDGVTAVYVKITSMWIKPQGGPAVQLPLENAPLTVDLLELTDTNAAVLIDEAVIEPGTYEWLAMDIAAERNTRDSYVMTETGAEEEIDLFVPSGRLRLVSGFDVEANQGVKLLFDWDMRQGLVFPPGQNRYLLKPAFRMIDVTEYGALEGSLSEVFLAQMSDCDPNPNDDEFGVVYVFAAGTTPDDIDGVDDPVATVAPTLNAGVYEYRTVLEPGDYTVAFTCDGAIDTPEGNETITLLTPPGPVTIENAGDVATVDF